MSWESTVTYDESCLGIITEHSKQVYLNIIDKLAKKGARGCILGCTEIGLLIQQKDIKNYYFEKNHKNNTSIIAHPDTFKEKVVGNLKVSSPILKEELKEKCNLILSREPKTVSKHIIFLGEIPQINNFEKRKSIGEQNVDGIFLDDYVMDVQHLHTNAKKVFISLMYILYIN